MGTALTFLSGCWTNSVEGSLVSSFPAGDLSHQLLWDSWEEFPWEPGAVIQK